MRRPLARSSRALALAGAALLALAISPPANAGRDGEIQVWTRHTDEGDVIAVARVPLPAAKIREFIADAERAHMLAPTTIKADAKTDGKCQKVHLKVQGLLSPLQLDTRRCPTAQGILETMVASDDFEAYTTEWVIQEMGDASMVSYRNRTVLNVSVPDGIILRQSKKVMAKTMRNLINALGLG